MKNTMTQFAFAGLPKMDGWKVISSEHNVTVLRGTEQHNASSIMLSYVIRAPPRLCMKVKIS